MRNDEVRIEIIAHQEELLVQLTAHLENLRARTRGT
jgi:hypothetical protein